MKIYPDVLIVLATTIVASLLCLSAVAAEPAKNLRTQEWGASVFVGDDEGLLLNYRTNYFEFGLGASYDYDSSTSTKRSYSKYSLTSFMGIRHQLHQNTYGSVGFKLDTQLVSNKSAADQERQPFGAELYLGIAYDLSKNLTVFGQLSGIRYEREDNNNDPKEFEVFDGGIIGLSYYF